MTNICIFRAGKYWWGYNKLSPFYTNMSRDSENVNLRSQARGASDTISPESSETSEGETPTEGGGDSGITVDQLYNELRSVEIDSEKQNVRLAPEQQSEVILEEVLTALFQESNFRFEESIVKENLDEILLMLIAHRSSDTHGKSLMGDLATIFGTRLSPGTVYPQLHELEDDGLLRVQELVRTKEYQVDDEEELTERVTVAMKQHLVLGLFFQVALEQLS